MHFGFGIIPSFSFDRNFGLKLNQKPKFDETTITNCGQKLRKFILFFQATVNFFFGQTFSSCVGSNSQPISCNLSKLCFTTQQFQFQYRDSVLI